MAFNKFKLVAAAPVLPKDPRRERRLRLVSQIDKQIAVIGSHQAGHSTRGRWWTVAETGQPVISIKYGRIALELAKGKTAIACEGFEEAIQALQEARQSALAGTFDEQLEVISAAVRKRLRKN